MNLQDQDAFAWTVSGETAGFYWTLELQGLPETITKVEVIQVEFAPNLRDLKNPKILFSVSTSTSDKPAGAGADAPPFHILGKAFCRPAIVESAPKEPMRRGGRPSHAPIPKRKRRN